MSEQLPLYGLGQNRSDRERLYAQLAHPFDELKHPALEHEEECSGHDGLCKLGHDAVVKAWVERDQQCKEAAGWRTSRCSPAMPSSFTMVCSALQDDLYWCVAACCR